MAPRKKKWYRSWFNSPYYHILYANRDLKEAELFIDNICNFLKPAPGARVLDIGCGRGRHSIYLHKKGLDVTGFDLSPENISYASAFANEHLQFFVHDMRNLFYINYFDYAFNIFTSFGYFSTERDNLRAINTFAKSLKPGGTLVFDFLNTDCTRNQIVHEETKEVQDITFHITRKVENNRIVKQIAFSDQGNAYDFREEVQALRLADFEKYFAQKGLKILHLFGDYELNPFREDRSERLIIIAQRS
jgi:SAM-dependent methyltransferase